MATLSPIEIDIGSKVASCSHVFWTPSHLLIPQHYCSHHVWKFFTAQFVFYFVFTEGFDFLASSIYFVGFLKRLKSLATETASLFYSLTAFTSFSFSKSLLLALHSSEVIDPNRFWERREQLATFFQISILTELSIAIGSYLDKMSSTLPLA